MAVAFSNLHTESGLKSLDEFLAGKSYISGDVFTKDDVKVYSAVADKPSSSFLNASSWHECVSKHLAARFVPSPQDSNFLVVGQAVRVRIVYGAAQDDASATAPSKATPTANDDDDDLDLFGDETEKEKKATEEREASKKASSKKKEILMDIKPWDDETDMKKLEEAVRGVEMEGLLWGASKLVPVGYGIKKLQIMLTIIDDLVSVDTLIEDRLTVEPINEYVQSCDIVAFNKI